MTAAGSLLWIGRRAYHRVALRARPPVLCNGMQKSGTHLLVALVAALPGLRCYERGAYSHHVMRTRVDPTRIALPADVVRTLDMCLAGEVYRGHLERLPAIAALLARRGFRHVLVLRDPRDVVVSLLHWWRRYGEIDVWPFRYFRALASEAERLAFLIDGWPADGRLPGFPDGVDFPDVGTRVRSFQPWLADRHTLALRFEDLVDQATRLATHRRLARWVCPELDGVALDQALARLTAAADPRRSATFRTGRAGGWRTAFSDAHRGAFKRHAGALLVELGYEHDLDW